MRKFIKYITLAYGVMSLCAINYVGGQVVLGFFEGIFSAEIYLIFHIFMLIPAYLFNVALTTMLLDSIGEYMERKNIK